MFWSKELFFALKCPDQQIVLPCGVVLPSIRRSTSASQRVSGAVLVAFNDDFLLGYPPATKIGFWSEIA